MSNNAKSNSAPEGAGKKGGMPTVALIGIGVVFLVGFLIWYFAFRGPPVCALDGAALEAECVCPGGADDAPCTAGHYCWTDEQVAASGVGQACQGESYAAHTQAADDARAAEEAQKADDANAQVLAGADGVAARKAAAAAAVAEAAAALEAAAADPEADTAAAEAAADSAQQDLAMQEALEAQVADAAAQVAADLAATEAEISELEAGLPGAEETGGPGAEEPAGTEGGRGAEQPAGAGAEEPGGGGADSAAMIAALEKLRARQATLQGTIDRSKATREGVTAKRAPAAETKRAATGSSAQCNDPNGSLQNNMQCMMTKLSNSAAVASNTANQLKFINRGNLMDCSNALSGNQSSVHEDVKMVAGLSTQVKKDILAMANQSADLKNKTNLVQSMNDIDNKLKMMSHDVNEGKFVNEGTWVCGPDGNIKINQENIAKMQAAMIVDTLMGTKNTPTNGPPTDGAAVGEPTVGSTTTTTSSGRKRTAPVGYHLSRPFEAYV